MQEGRPPPEPVTRPPTRGRSHTQARRHLAATFFCPHPMFRWVPTHMRLQETLARTPGATTEKRQAAVVHLPPPLVATGRPRPALRALCPNPRGAGSLHPPACSHLQPHSPPLRPHPPASPSTGNRGLVSTLQACKSKSHTLLARGSQASKEPLAWAADLWFPQRAARETPGLHRPPRSHSCWGPSPSYRHSTYL